MKLRIAAAACLLLALLSPGTAGRAGVVPGTSDNVDLVTQFPDIQVMGGRFVGHYLYATGTTGLRIFDVSNPEMPLLTGTVPMPIFSNEDVDVSVSRKLVLISSDFGGDGLIGALTVVDVSNPMLPMIKGVLNYDTLPPDPKGEVMTGVGHIANCIADCARYAWVTGARDGVILVVDLKDPATPKAAGYFVPYAGQTHFVPSSLGLDQNIAGHHIGVNSGNLSLVHDVNVDKFGDVWMMGTGGVARIDARDPLHPKEIAKSSKADNDKMDQFILHNSERLDRRTLLVTEEDWIEPQCNAGKEGSFQTWQVPANGRGRLKPLDEWTTELGTFVDGGTPAAVACSSHWFDLNSNKIVADAWYQQGIRFLDVSKPKNIRQIGYYIPPWEAGGLGVSQALWVPGHPDLVYGMSLSSGVIVLRLGNGTKAVRAPILSQWLEPSTMSFTPHPVFGYACAVERPR